MPDFTVVNVEQRSPEWFAARCGRVTSSCVDAIFMQGRTKGSESVTKRDLRVRLALERLTGRPADDSTRTSDMQYGVDREPDARCAYEAQSGFLVREAGFLKHDELLVGCSLDGYVGEFVGITEFKCPKSATHLEYIRSADIPAGYLPQLRHQLWITGAEWADFVSFDDRLPAPLQLVVRRLWAKDAALDAHALAVSNFLAEIQKEIADIEALMTVAA